MKASGIMVATLASVFVTQKGVKFSPPLHQFWLKAVCFLGCCCEADVAVLPAQELLTDYSSWPWEQNLLKVVFTGTLCCWGRGVSGKPLSSSVRTSVTVWHTLKYEAYVKQQPTVKSGGRWGNLSFSILPLSLTSFFHVLSQHHSLNNLVHKAFSARG